MSPSSGLHRQPPCPEPQAAREGARYRGAAPSLRLWVPAHVPACSFGGGRQQQSQAPCRRTPQQLPVPPHGRDSCPPRGRCCVYWLSTMRGGRGPHPRRRPPPAWASRAVLARLHGRRIGRLAVRHVRTSGHRGSLPCCSPWHWHNAAGPSGLRIDKQAVPLHARSSRGDRTSQHYARGLRAGSRQAGRHSPTRAAEFASDPAPPSSPPLRPHHGSCKAAASLPPAHLPLRVFPSSAFDLISLTRIADVRHLRCWTVAQAISRAVTYTCNTTRTTC